MPRKHTTQDTELYFRLFKIAADAVFIADAGTGKLVDVNPAAVRLTGRSRKELIGMEHWRLHPLQQKEVSRQLFHKAVTAEKPFFTESDIITRDGRIVPVEIHSGGVIAFSDKKLHMGIFRDLSRRQKLERRLQESEEKYRSLYENSPLAYQSLDESGSFLDVNPAWLKALGYTKEEIIGTSFAGLLHPDWRPHFEKNFPAFKERGYVHDVQFKVRHKDGTYRDISFEGCISYNPDGSFRQTYCVFKDITQLKQIESALKQSEKEKTLILESTRETMTYVDTDLNIIWANKAAAATTGVEPDKMIGQKCYAAWGHGDSPCQNCHLVKTIADGSAQEIETNGKNGKRWLLRGYPVFDDSGQILGAVEFGQDITEQQRIMEDLKMKLSEVERFNRALVDRELRMVELKKEINDLCRKAAQPPRYRIPE